MDLQIPRANALQRAIQWWAAKPRVSQVLARILPRLDRLLIRATKGKVTATSLLAGLPVIWLTTMGANSQQKRATPLIAIPDEGKLIVIASNFGNKRHPGWYYNILENPRVEVSFPNQTALPLIARPATDKERIRYWEAAFQLYPGFHAYKERAAPRKIPVVVLTSA